MKLLRRFIFLPFLLLILISCSDDENSIPEPEINVFERLQGNNYRQVESASQCGTCCLLYTSPSPRDRG